MRETMLPSGWKTFEATTYAGSGLGDERWGWYLFRLTEVTRGILWWRKTKIEWVRQGTFDTQQQAASYALDIEFLEMLQ